MAWIESDQKLRQHPKTLKAARILKIKKVQLIGHLHCLWWWVLDNAEDGDLQGFDAEEIAAAAEWEDDATEFISALLDCGRDNGAGFLEGKIGALVIHDWMDHAGKLIAKRAADRDRKKKTAQPFQQIPMEFPRNPPEVAENRTDSTLRAPVTVTPTVTLTNQADQPDRFSANTPRLSPGQPRGCFEEWWSRYPKKTGKQKCWTWWERSKPSMDQRAHMHVALDWQLTSTRWTKEGGAYIPDPMTYLNGARWEDDPAAYEPRGPVSDPKRGLTGSQIAEMAMIAYEQERQQDDTGTDFDVPF